MKNLKVNVNDWFRELMSKDVKFRCFIYGLFIEKCFEVEYIIEDDSVMFRVEDNRLKCDELNSVKMIDEIKDSMKYKN